MARYRFWLAGAAILGVLVWFASHRGSRQPRYAGRSVQAWFEDWLRAGGGGGTGSEIEALRARTALAHLGTNAVPFLVEQAFLFRPDFAYRSNLHQLSQGLPRWLGRGRFIPYGRHPIAALEMLWDLRPPAPLIHPLISGHLAGTNVLARRQAILLLGHVRPPLDLVLPHLIEAATNRTDAWTSLHAIQSLWHLGAATSNALPVLLPELEALAPHVRFVEWLGEMGPLASPAVPWLEQRLATTNSWARGTAALALRRIQPGHREAYHTIARLLADPTPLNGGQTVSSQTLAGFLRGNLRPIPDPELAVLIGPLAEADVRTWSPAGGSYSALNALSVVAPEQARWLCLGALDGPGAIHAAGHLLRWDRNHARATEILTRDPTGNGGLRIWWLGEASSTNQAAITCLEALSQPPTAEPWRQAAAASLARLRYREALEAQQGR